MTNAAKVVIGAGFGDEGKGLITDYLSVRHGADVVVRFNGGAQAGHTVETPAGERHIFSHLSAGTFAGAATFLSNHFIVNPMIFFKELEAFSSEFRTMPLIYCDYRAYVTTPYDMLINQLIEEQRSSGRHGSCGIGIGETIERSIDVNRRITFGHIVDNMDEVGERLKYARDVWFPKRCKALGLDPTKGDDVVKNVNVFKNFLADCEGYAEIVKELEVEELYNAHQIVFEGAQGLLLDQDYGEFPHVTRSNTGLINVLSICDEAEIDEIDITYATRCYLTRHGAGPMSNELPSKPYPNIVDKTNIKNTYQGSLRFGYLNLDDVREAIAYDLNCFDQLKIIDRDKMTAGLAVTCLDQIDNEVKVIHNGNLQTLRGDQYGDVGDMINMMVGLKGPLLKSYGPTRATVKEQG